jgi:predicted HD phosphohydrolase
MQFFTPYFVDKFEVKIYDKKGKEDGIKKLGAQPVSFDEAA